MKKIFYFILAAAAIVASCAKEPINKEIQPVNPTGDALFSASIIQPNGINDTRVSIVDDPDYPDNVFINWNAGDKIYVKPCGDSYDWVNAVALSAQSDGATTTFEGEALPQQAETYTARYYGNSDQWKSYVQNILEGTSDNPYVEYYESFPNYNPVALQNMPLYCAESVRQYIVNELKFSCEYAILQINMPKKLQYDNLYVCVNAQQVEFENGLKADSEYTLCVKNAGKIQAETGKDYVKIYVPVVADSYSKLTLVASKGTETSEAQVAWMQTYSESNINLAVNTIYFFDYSNTKTIDAAGAYNLASNDKIDYKVNISAAISDALTINATDAATAPANIYINARNKKVDNLTINAPYSHVEIDYGQSVNVVAKTNAGTFVVKEHFTINKVTVNKGSVVVAGNEQGKANVEEIVIPSDAEGQISIDVTGVEDNSQKVVIDNKKEEGVAVVTDAQTEEQKEYELKEESKPVTEVTKETVATIETTNYSSLAEAIAAVGDGQTITLVKDVANAAGISVASGKNFTVDFGGHSYAMECPGAGSASTQTAGFQLLKNSTITFKNGTISCTEANKTKTWEKSSTSKGVAIMIQNYANLTLDGITIDARNIAHNGAAVRYALSNNSGNVEYKGATSIITAEGDKAFDVCKYDTYEAPIVTWNSTGSVNGGIEISGGTLALNADLCISAPVYVVSSNVSTLNLNGKKLYNTSDIWEKDSAKEWAELVRVEGGKLEINDTENGSVAAKVGDCYAVNVRNNGELTINGGTFKGNVSAVQVVEGTATILGGSFEQQQGTGYDKYVLNCADASYKAGTAKIIVKGGSFKNFNPADNAAEGEHTNFVADGYAATENSGVWTVAEAGVAKIGNVSYKTLADAVAAAEAGQTVEIVKADTYTIPTINKNITIEGKSGVDVVFNCAGSGSIASIPNGATFKNVTMNIGQSGYHGFQHAGPITMEECTLNGLLISYGDMTFKNCIFNQDAKEYNMWCYGDDVTYDGCTFNSKGKFINVYCESNSVVYNIVAKNCAFNTSEANKAALNIKETCGATSLKYNVTISGCTCNDTQKGVLTKEDESSNLYVGSPIWQVDDRKVGANGIKVTVDDKVVYENGVGYYIATISALKAFAKSVNAGKTFEGKTVTLDADIDLKDYAWNLATTMSSYPSIGFFGTFEGQNHIISNMTSSANEQNYAAAGFIGAGHCTIKDLTLKDVNVTSTHYAGAFVGYASSAVNLSNCKLIGGKVISTPELIGEAYDNGDKAGGLVGYASDDNGGLIDNCSVEGVEVRAYRDLGGIAGAFKGTISNCVVKNSSIIQDNTNGYKAESVTTYGAIIGRTDLGAIWENQNNTTESVTVKSEN